MYEDKTKKGLNFKNLNIDWKSLIIKLAILLIVVFIVLLLISIVKKDDKKLESNLSTNLQAMRTAAKDYFVGSKLPTNVNGRKKITLEEMFDDKLLVEFKDQNNKTCDTIGSFAEATKINNTDYTIKVKLVCGSESDYVIDNVSFPDDSVDVPVDNTTNTDNNQTNTNTTTNNNGSTTTKKPSSNQSTTTKKPVTNVTKPSTGNNTTIANSCTYGNKDYTSNYPLAYIIPGNCAASISDYYKAEYANKVSSISATEYRKLNDEMVALKNKTGANLYLESPEYSRVLNKTNNGFVGYQILFTMKEKHNYVTTTVYQYYLDINGNRKVVVDKRNSINSSTNNNNNNNNNTNTNIVRVKSVALNRTSIDLDVNDTFNLTVSINPTNATNKNVSWSTSNSRVVSVNSNGKITALREGSATITASVDGKSASVRVYVYEEQTYRYCNTNTERVYSTNYIKFNDLKTRTNFTYQVALTTNNYNYYDLEYGNLTTENEYREAYNYAKNPNKPLSFVSGGTGTGNVDAGNYTNVMNYSLKSYNFKPTVSYVRRSGNKLYFDINVRIKNLDFIKDAFPYNGVYFLPLYFDVTTIDYNDCRNITSSQINSYKNRGYVKVN